MCRKVFDAQIHPEVKSLFFCLSTKYSKRDVECSVTCVELQVESNSTTYYQAFIPCCWHFTFVKKKGTWEKPVFLFPPPPRLLSLNAPDLQIKYITKPVLLFVFIISGFFVCLFVLLCMFWLYLLFKRFQICVPKQISLNPIFLGGCRSSFLE